MKSPSVVKGVQGGPSVLRGGGGGPGLQGG